MSRAENAEDAKGRGSDRIAPAPLGVLSVLCAKYSVISARDQSLIAKLIDQREHCFTNFATSTLAHDEP